LVDRIGLPLTAGRTLSRLASHLFDYAEKQAKQNENSEDAKKPVKYN
jgi:hypothetical protein